MRISSRRNLFIHDLTNTKRHPQRYVRRYAHCEYENGFLIFDRLGAAKEVWRLATLWPASESTTSLPRVFRPTDSQLEASAAAARALEKNMFSLNGSPRSPRELCTRAASALS